MAENKEAPLNKNQSCGQIICGSHWKELKRPKLYCDGCTMKKEFYEQCKDSGFKKYFYVEEIQEIKNGKIFKKFLNKKQENKIKTKPSDFTNYPWSSVFGRSEYETVAYNIMKILQRNGDIFYGLKWGDYKIERLKDGNFSENEKIYFDQVMPYCVNAESAKKFSKDWAD